MILQRYLATKVLSSIALSVCLVVGVDVLLALVREMKTVGTAEYTTTVAVQYILLTLPRRFNDLFAVSCLLGTIFALSHLASTGELVAMRANGFSKRKIGQVVLLTAGCLAIFVGFVSETIAPQSEHQANILKATARGGGHALFTAKGTWFREGSSYIYLTESHPNGEIRGILRFDFDEQKQLIRAVRAENGQISQRRWLLSNVSVSHITEGGIQVKKNPTMIWKTSLKGSLLSVLVREPETLSLRELLPYIKYLKRHQLDYQKYELAGIRKIVNPLSVIVMLSLAVPFVFGPLRTASMGVHLLTGIFTGFTYYTLNELFGPMALVYGFSPWIGAVFPCFVFGALGFMLFRRSY